MKFFFSLLLLSQFILVDAQTCNEQYNLFIGGQYGGPLPKEMNDSASGKPLFSPKIGSQFSFKTSQKTRLAFGFSISQKGAEYQQVTKRDTLVDVGFGFVPTFYAANVVGEMKLWYVDFPIDFCYFISQKQAIGIGINPAFLISGHDKGEVAIHVGYGGFADFAQQFNNYSAIQKVDFGAHLMYRYQFYKHLFTSIEVYRSLRGLYKNSDNNLYHTHVSINLGYCF